MIRLEYVKLGRYAVNSGGRWRLSHQRENVYLNHFIAASVMDQIAYVERMPAVGETLHGKSYQVGFGGIRMSSVFDDDVSGCDGT